MTMSPLAVATLILGVLATTRGAKACHLRLLALRLAYPCPPKPVSAATAKLDQLKEEIQSGVTALVRKEWQACGQAVVESASSQNPRLQALEVAVTELQAQAGKFEDWFSTIGQKVSAQEESQKQVAATLQAQQTQLSSVQSDVARTAEAIQTTVTSAVSNLGNQLGEKIGSQMAQQTAMLESILQQQKAAEPVHKAPKTE